MGGPRTARVIGSGGGWVRDAWMAGLDVMVTGVSGAGALVRWLAGLAGVWAELALRQGWLAVRAFRRGAG